MEDFGVIKRNVKEKMRDPVKDGNSDCEQNCWCRDSLNENSWIVVHTKEAIRGGCSR